MEARELSESELNFARFTIICLDILTRVLKDILYIFIKPGQLVKRIKSNNELRFGDFKLNVDQLTKCCYYSPKDLHDYIEFDTTLLYKLIRNLCHKISPQEDWGKVPTEDDKGVVHDMNRIRELRNKHFAHAVSANISNEDYKKLWENSECIIQRCEAFTKTHGYRPKYNEELTKLNKNNMTFQEYQLCRDRSRAIYISGKSEVLCGEVACLKVEITREQYVTLPVSWNKIEGPVREDGSVRVDLILKSDKYKGSDHRQLLIHNVCKKDEAGYEAVIIGDGNHKIASNEIVLRASGDPPDLNDLNVRANNKELHIDYSFGVSNHLPVLKEIKWSKNNVELDLSNAKYRGGGLNDKCITISSPNKEDEGVYTCIVSSAAGSITKQVKIDLPSAIVTSSTKVICGSDTRLSCCISGCPYPDKVQWQKSIDGETFISIDGWNGKYHLDSGDQYPTLILQNAEFGDQQYYRVIVSNVLAECTSNKIFLQVIGDKPNISGGTCILNGRSVKLKFDVFVYDESPAVTDVYWTKKVAKESKEDVIGTSNTRYKVNTNDRSLTITDVYINDAGTYRLNATNPVGTTTSEAIVLDDPDVSLEKYDEREDGSLCFTMKIKSVPVPNLVQWKIKENNSEAIQPLDVNDVDFKGTSHSFPNPVLVIKYKTILENYSFELEVQNRIGRKTGKINQDTITKDQETAGKFYANAGSDIPFGKLFVELDKKFPMEKIRFLKNLVRLSCNIELDNDTATELTNATFAGDVFNILFKKEVFKPSDVMVMQFLLQQTECEELEKKCVEYAKKHNAMYYYETPPDEDSQNVRFHVVANRRHFTPEDVAKIRKTVAEILDCSLDEVQVKGYLHSTSFVLVLSIKNIYIEKLLAINQHEKDKLMKLKIDYFEYGNHTVMLEHTAGVKDEKTNMSLQSKSSTKQPPKNDFPPNIKLNPKQLMTSEHSTLVTKTEHCKDIASLLSQEKILAVDCQGVYRGSHLRLTLLQIGTSKGDVYLFDVHENRDLLSGGPLKNLLESEEIEKVMFKCSKDSGALYHGFQITLRNVFDIQDAHILLEEEKKGRKLFPSLMLRDVCQVYSSTDKVSKDEEEIMKICAEDSSTFWEKRPFTDKMMSVAVGNVRALIPEVYGKQKRLIEDCGLNRKFQERVLESVQLNIDRAFKKRRRDRIHECAMKILHSTNRACTTTSTLVDFAEDGEEMIALRIVNFEDVQNMSEKIQQLKKEHINMYLDKIRGEIISDKPETLVTLGKLRFLKKTKYHPDTSIAKKAKDIRKEIQNIILTSIEKKYDENTKISSLTETEQDILRPLNIWTEADTEYPPLINILFWRLLEKEMDKKSETLRRYRSNFKLNEHFFEKMKKFASSPTSVAVPNHVRANAKTFLDDIRLYNVNTNLESRDGGAQ